MIDFKIEYFMQTKGNISYSTQIIKSNYDEVDRLYAKMKEEIKEAERKTNSQINAAKDELNYLEKVLAYNQEMLKKLEELVSAAYQAHSEAIIARGNAQKEFDHASPESKESAAAALKSAENAVFKASSMIDKSEREKKHCQYLISNLIDIRKAIKKDISDLEIFIMKLHKCDSDMYNAHKNFRDSSDIIIDKLTHIGKLCDEIYELMHGVFTSCKIENVNLLIELKSNLSTYLYKIETRLDEISTGMNEFGAGIMNTDFVNTSIEKISSIKESVSQTRVSLVQDCKQLDEYIKVLNEYLEYINK